MAFDPTGKSFKQRLEAFLNDAKATYKVTVGQDPGRTVEWQQTHHVAHMFLYNSFNTKPANTAAGKKTIDWKYFSDPTVTWATIDWKDFLRTAKNAVPVKDGKKWKAGSEPHEDATRKQTKSLLTKAGVGNGGKAMVASGLKPCGEPCKCKVGRSNHLDGLAADLENLSALETALKKANAGSLDDYMKKFGLHRPLKNHAKSPEPWHAESL